MTEEELRIRSVEMALEHNRDFMVAMSNARTILEFVQGVSITQIGKLVSFDDGPAAQAQSDFA